MKPRTTATRPLAALLGLALLATAAPGQDQPDSSEPTHTRMDQPAQPGPAPAPAIEPLVELPPEVSLESIGWTPPAWTGERVARVGDMLEGSWQTTGTIGALDGGAPTRLILHAARVQLADLDNTMYVEITQADVPEEASWQAIWQLYEYQGHVRLRTLKPQTFQWGLEAFAGFWAIPDQFPLLASTDLLATMDIDLAQTADGFEGSSPHPYPTVYGGAVEMTTSIVVTPDSLITTDRGTDASGALVWGPDSGMSWDWTRSEASVLVRRPSSGVIVINYVGQRGASPDDGDFVQWSYIGWIHTDGRRFSTSELSGRPMGFPAPIGPTTVNRAWYEGCRDEYLGATRRFLIPSSLAYGVKGDVSRFIMPNSPIVVLAKCVGIQKPPQGSPIVPPRDGGRPPQTPRGNGG